MGFKGVTQLAFVIWVHNNICVLDYLCLLRNLSILKIIAIPRNVALTTLKLFSMNPEMSKWIMVHRSQVTKVRPLPFPITPIILPLHSHG
ncbi:hypothetical protein EDB85DRAFT_2149953 [Lactarius pseudohatsudake]|nr:hypothetical protein EDB85DRAFT_2149953 [Lactarius pseudohatsudake]